LSKTKVLQGLFDLMFLERHQQKVIDATSLSLNDENLYENIALNYQDRTIVKPTEGTRKSIPLM
jgi:predicted KAP-like P-loop ATPase